MNQTILITGAAKRVGKEMALSFFKKGWNIIIHYNSSNGDAQSLADEMNAQRKNSAFIIQANLDLCISSSIDGGSSIYDISRNSLWCKIIPYQYKCWRSVCFGNNIN